MHFRMPGFFRSSSSSSASLNNLSNPISPPPPPPPPPPVVAAVAWPVAAPAVSFVADTIEQVHEVPPHKHENESEAHLIYRDAAGHAPKGLLPQTVNPVRSPPPIPSLVIADFSLCQRTRRQCRESNILDRRE